MRRSSAPAGCGWCRTAGHRHRGRARLPVRRRPGAAFGLGLAVAMVGVIVSLPFAVRPLTAVIAAPMRLRGLPGELAKQNAMRNPRRTASTAAALMIGLTLVVSMSVFASSLKDSFGEVIGDKTSADLFVTPASAQGPGFSPSVVDAVADVTGVEEISASGWGEARFDGRRLELLGDRPGHRRGPDEPRPLRGLARRPRARTAWWSPRPRPTATAGSSATPWRRSSPPPASTGCTSWASSTRRAGSRTTTSSASTAQNAFAGPQLVTSALVSCRAGADQDEVQDAITAALADHPDAKVLDQDEFEAEASGIIDGLLTFVTVMLLLAVIIALLGIVNTLALSVFERTRELGLLRAVGMTRGQVRAMVRWESVVISLIGAVSGAGLGIGIGLALSQALEDEGITGISVPGPQIALYVALAAVAGVLAALGPARSAAKVDVLKAVVTD